VPKERMSWEGYCELADMNLRHLEDPNSFVTMGRLVIDPLIVFKKDKGI